MFKTEISFIVPVYRVKKYLSRCLDSLLNQDFEKPYNIILVETGSDDGSDLICEKYQRENLGKVYHFHYPKKECISTARNLGLHHANGKYVSFVDGDDVVSSDFLSSLYKKTEESNNAQVVFLGYDILKTAKKAKKGFAFSYHGMGRDVLLKLFHRQTKFRGYCWGGLYSRSFLLVNRLCFDPEMKLYEDMLFVYKCLFLATNVIFSKKVCYHYILNEGSTMANSKDWLSPHLKCLEKFSGYLWMQDGNYYKKLFDKIHPALKRQLKLDCKRSYDSFSVKEKELYKSSVLSCKGLLK